MRAALEEQCLGDDRLHRVRLVGLGDEEGGFRPLAGQEPVGIGGDEDHRHREGAKHLVDGVEARAAVGELDVGEHEARPVLIDGLDGFGVGARHTGDAVAKALDDAFEVHGDHRLVLDNEHVGRNLRGDFAASNIDQRVNLGHVAVENLPRLGGGKAFHRAEQKSLARNRRYRLELAVDRRCGAGRHLGLEIDADRIPQAEKGAIERDPRIERIVEERRILDQHF